MDIGQLLYLAVAVLSGFAGTSWIVIASRSEVKTKPPATIPFGIMLLCTSAVFFYLLGRSF